MYVNLLRLAVELTGNPLLFLGLIVLLMASWGLIVTAVFDIGVRLFDVQPDLPPRLRHTRLTIWLSRLRLTRTR